MLTHPQFDPVAIQIGPIAVHWYGLTYLVAFGLFLWLASLRVKHAPFAERGWTRREVEDLMFYGVLGVIIGGRLGYVVLYKPGYYAAPPYRAHRQLHHRRAVGPLRRPEPAVGDGLSAVRLDAAAASVAAVPVRA